MVQLTNIIDCNRNLTFYYIFVIHLKSLQYIINDFFEIIFCPLACSKKAITLQVGTQFRTK